MRNIYLALIVLSSVSHTVFAQSDTIKLDHFRLPTTPAASVLNLGAYSIARPTTPQAVATSLISGLGGATLNPNVSLEFSPYWLKPRKDIDFYEYYGINRRFGDIPVADVWGNMMKTLAVSVATSKLNDQRDTLTGTRLAIGLRTQLFSGKIPQQLKLNMRLYVAKIDMKDLIQRAVKEILDDNSKSASLKNKIATENGIFNELDNAMTEYFKLMKQQEPNKSDSILTLAQDFVKEYLAIARKTDYTVETVLQNLRKTVLDKSAEALALQKIKSENKDKVGFIWEIAMAGVQYFPENQFGKSLYQKTGIWSTMSHRTIDQKSEFSFLTRYTFSKADSVSSNFDLGVSANRIVDKGFNYGLEIIYRFYDYRYPTKDISGNNIQAIRSGSTFRMALNMEYKISEVISLNASLGKDYNTPFVVNSNLLALIGANISLPSLAGLVVQR